MFLETTPNTTLAINALYYPMRAPYLFQNLQAIIPSGIIGLLGVNGSGKSTLLRILSGLCQPFAGEISFNGQNLYRHKFNKNMLGYVPTQPILYPHLTVLENLYFVASLKKIEKNQKTKQITDVLQQCDIVNYQAVIFGKLSDGLKKRVMIASQILHEPKLLVLDEPCAELDPQQRHELWKILQMLRQDDRVILFSSHHPQEIFDFCDRVYTLDHGQLEVASFEMFRQTFWTNRSETLIDTSEKSA